MTPQEMINFIIEHYEPEEQERQVMEECGELIQAVNKFHRKPTKQTRSDLIGEMADVTVMIKQLQAIHNITDGELECMIKYKLERQMRRIEGEKIETNVCNV